MDGMSNNDTIQGSAYAEIIIGGTGSDILLADGSVRANADEVWDGEYNYAADSDWDYIVTQDNDTDDHIYKKNTDTAFFNSTDTITNH